MSCGRADFSDWTLLNDGTDTPFTANDPDIMMKFPGLFAQYLKEFGGRSSRFNAELFTDSPGEAVARG